MSDSYKNNNINLKDLFHFALTKWKIFAVLAVFFVAAAAIYSYLLATPLYDSAGKIYIINKETLTSAEISASTYLTRDYTNLIADAAVLSDVSDKLGKKYSVSELKNAITVNNPENTRFIEISVRTASANDSKVIVDTVCTVAQEKITELLGVDRVTIIRKGTVAASPSVPNKTKILWWHFCFPASHMPQSFSLRFILTIRLRTLPMLKNAWGSPFSEIFPATAQDGVQNKTF